jgi:hypothetical protein
VFGDGRYDEPKALRLARDEETRFLCVVGRVRRENDVVPCRRSPGDATSAIALDAVPDWPFASCARSILSCDAPSGDYHWISRVSK